ncbi:MAG TPA: hypothetical protein VK633_02220, partial [Verrucomicrobiae bacterium]|nr:hypothetical protein [Verrucomicrobiae bacterium]
MPDQAHVTSVEALEAFRASLLIYLSRARPILEEACDDVMRLRQSLQNERRMHWENDLRQRRKALEAAQQALFSAGLSNLGDIKSTEQRALQQARRALAESEEKLRLVKRWNNDFDHRVAPAVKQLEHLRSVLSNHLPKAVMSLGQLVRTLDAYAGVQPGAASSPPTGTPATNLAEESA